MNNKMIEYQMFTKCNLKCSYCYNYFDQSVQALETHILDFKKISSLADKKTCLVLNGGEPLLLKELAKVINSIEVETNILTYTNGALPLKIYQNFVDEVKKENLYFTVSIHYAELIRTNNIDEKYKTNLKFLIENIPNLKVNIVFTEDFIDENFVCELLLLLKDLKSFGLKYINILLEDNLKKDPARALQLVKMSHFKNFFEELKMFKYKHCMWNNPDDDISCLQIWLRKECMSSVLPYKELSFLKYDNEFIVESNFKFDSKYVDGDKITNIDSFIEDIKPQLYN
jgi:molybdenum cofactor biosynthesis enzyme MoaA